MFAKSMPDSPFTHARRLPMHRQPVMRDSEHSITRPSLLFYLLLISFIWRILANVATPLIGKGVYDGLRIRRGGLWEAEGDAGGSQDEVLRARLIRHELHSGRQSGGRL